MPNWCSNTLEVTGPSEDLERFIQAARTPESEEGKGGQKYHLLAQLVPMPEVLAGTTSPIPPDPDPLPSWAESLAEGKIDQAWYDSLCQHRRDGYAAGVAAEKLTGYTDWYEWQAANWGVKWGDAETYLADSGSGWAEFRFDTPWGPAIPAFTAISEMFPTLRFVLGYHEAGCAIVGAARFINGQVSEVTSKWPSVSASDPEDLDAVEAAWQEEFEAAIELMSLLTESLA